jgi:hypothetical protein
MSIAVRPGYASSTTFTITLASLAASSTLLVGRGSLAVDNTITPAADYLIGGIIKAGTSPTAGVFQVWAVAAIDDTPTYLDGYAGTDSAVTFTNADIQAATAKLLVTGVTTTTTNQVYGFGPVSLLSAYSVVGAGWQSVPKKWGVFVTHSMVATMNSAGSSLTYTPVFNNIG